MDKHSRLYLEKKYIEYRDEAYERMNIKRTTHKRKFIDPLKFQEFVRRYDMYVYEKSVRKIARNSTYGMVSGRVPLWSTMIIDQHFNEKLCSMHQEILELWMGA